tara:strand:+ start:163 stop:564 length:402 start_codon:yes stop_codon:yes gene_type:complete
MEGIGAKLPLERDSEFGFYNLNTEFADEIKQNFKNLLLTCPGERVMIPQFGVGLRNFLFEPKVSAVPKIKQKINQQVSKYLPFIEIVNLAFDENLTEAESLESKLLAVRIEFTVKNTNLNSSITVSAEDIITE